MMDRLFAYRVNLMFHAAAWRTMAQKGKETMIKDGWKTTEFWLTLISTLVSATVALGLLPAGEGEQLEGGMSSIVVGVFGIVPVGLYIWGRAKVKAAAVEGVYLGDIEPAE